MDWQGESWAIQEDDADGTQEDETAYRYSDYLSYCKDRNPAHPIWAWTLSDDQLDRFRTRYLIIKPLNSNEVKEKIDDLLRTNARRIKEKDDFWFDVPKREERFIDYCHILAMPLLRKGHTAKRSFSNGSTRHQACLTAWLLNYLLKNVGKGYRLTERKIYYAHKLLFRSPEAVAKALTDVCCMLECTEISLDIVAEEKGSVRGELELKMTLGNLHCGGGVKLPTDIREISEIVVDDTVEFVLLVEKRTMYNALSDANFHKKHNCILVSGNGEPDERTRAFVRMLDEKLDIPIFGIADPDPYGIGIMKVYAKGSINLAHCNVSYATNSLHWLGISTDDITQIRHETLEYVLKRCQVLSQKERSKLQNMKSHKYGLSIVWTRRIDHMLYFNKKACFEDLNVLGEDYAVNIHIPELIERAKNSMATKRGNGCTSSSPHIVPPPKNVPTLSFDELRRKKESFGYDTLFHDGPYGKIYSAVLDEGKLAAVKRLNSLAGQEQDNEFIAHVHTASGLKHDNVANLLGYCIEGDQHLLVYEFTAIGSLRDVLHGRKSVAGGAQFNLGLDWMQRVKIAVDAAKGLKYLHEKEQSKPSIVHGDIKSSNILLFDNNEKAKILDFKLSSQSADQNYTRDLGNQQYLAPEYKDDQSIQLTTEGGVYSFGVVLLELLTGKSPADEMPRGQTLITWATDRIRRGHFNQTVDQNLNRKYDVESATKFAGVALSCLKITPMGRPGMGTVVDKLSTLTPTLVADPDT